MEVCIFRSASVRLSDNSAGIYRQAWIAFHPSLHHLSALDVRCCRQVIVGILILAPVFIPPDIFSQLALAIPMWLLYELGIVLGYLFVRKADRKKLHHEA